MAGELLRYFFAETSEGRETVKKLGVDSATIAKLNVRVEPLVKAVDTYFPESGQP